MKKLVLFSLVILIIAGMTSCQKEGVFNPSQKIEKIYVEKGGANVLAKYLSEEWKWNGKLLESITYYNPSGIVIYTNKYSYDDKNRLTTITQNNGTEITYTYDGKFLTTIEDKYKDKLMAQSTVEHDGKQISKIVTTYYDAKSTINSALRFFIPEESIAQLNTATKKAITENQGKGGSYTTTMSLTWDGKNVSKCDIITTINGVSNTETTSYTYDNGKNPVRNFLDLDYSSLTKNNVLQATTGKNVLNYTYQYDKHDYPTSQSWKTPSLGGEVEITNYYEYED